ncbi:MAG: biotin--[acetyl-CoA-carboxylase] ligase [Deltaproteobacteria bacterium]|nr:biotin--[acetyl-CoA-carboxylase] ligase [Deltaproteobacteria bacterium]MBZ0220096.1 biotin--[acetyl-CoA-carboxylase] ligase [Deltaproteobacteria bacterium]
MRDKGPETEIIRLLKAGPGHVSGQKLSRALKVSRTAVWKHIEALRKSGYTIEASPSKGYRLLGPLPFNGVEVSSLLETGFIGRELHFHDEVGSTNAEAFELARNGASEGTVVMAESQTGGKGRLGRRWESPSGLNIYLSIILRPPIPPEEAHWLTFVAAVATAEAVSGYCPAKPVVKWPNDILINGRKAAGILLEMGSEPERVHFVVMGIGVNVNMTRSMFPEYIGDTATSVREAKGAVIDRGALASRLLSSVELWYKVYLAEGSIPILSEWKRYFGFEGKEIRVVSFGNTVKGVCLGVDDTGALLIREPGGAVKKIVAGDMEAASR